MLRTLRLLSPNLLWLLSLHRCKKGAATGHIRSLSFIPVASTATRVTSPRFKESDLGWAVNPWINWMIQRIWCFFSKQNIKRQHVFFWQWLHIRNHDLCNYLYHVGPLGRYVMNIPASWSTRRCYIQSPYEDQRTSVEAAHPAVLPAEMSYHSQRWGSNFKACEFQGWTCKNSKDHGNQISNQLYSSIQERWNHVQDVPSCKYLIRRNLR